jgi:hypothetical protein
MKMQNVKEILIESTVDLLPHKYFLNSAGKLIAFQKCNEDVVKTFSKPLSFDKRYRKFIKVES